MNLQRGIAVKERKERPVAIAAVAPDGGPTKWGWTSAINDQALQNGPFDPNQP